MKLPKLFKKNKNSSTQTWEIEVINDTFITHEGLLDGKITTSKPTVCEAMNIGRANATTAEEQAYKEALAKWKKQTEQGYYEDIKDINKGTVHFEPMLCHKWDERKSKINISNGLFVQPKLDGIRCICKKDGMWTRNGKQIISAPHIHFALKPLFDKNPEFIFDGELYCDKFKYDFNKIISLVRKTKPTLEDLQESAKYIQYWIYDFPSYNDIFSKRHEKLCITITKTFPDCIRILETYHVTNEKEIDEYFYKWLEKGFEGQIIRLDKLYENKRSVNILKRKEFQDTEYEIIGYGEGEGNKTGMMGYFVFKTKDGKEFNSNIKGSHEYLEQLWKNKNTFIGKQATIKYFNLTPDGIPRFPYVIAIRDYE